MDVERPSDEAIARARHQRARAIGRLASPLIALVYAAFALLYLLAPPLTPAAPYALGSGCSALIFLVVWALLERAPDRWVNALFLLLGMTGVGFALCFPAFSGDPAQTVVLIISILGLSALQPVPWITALTSVVGVIAWSFTAAHYEPAAYTHWAINLGSSVVIGLIITASRSRLLARVELGALTTAAASERLREQAGHLAAQSEDLRRARDEALSSTRAKSRFLATVTHELRTPLNAIIGGSELLVSSALSDHQRDYVETVRSSADALLSVIGNILDFSKIEAGKLELESAPFELATVLEDSLEIVAHVAAAKRLDLGARLSAELPTRVTGDASRLRQVLLNLLSNAVKFTDAGEVTLEAAVAREDEDALWVSIVVRDTGIGVAEADLERLFQVFSQLDDSARRLHSGTGLGLAISRELIEAMGGSIECASVKGEGTTFTILVPFARAGLARAELDALSGHALILSRKHSRLELLAAQLAAWGLSLERARVPASARARLAEAGAPGWIAIVDRELVDADWMARLGEEPAPVIVLSSPGDATRRARADDRVVSLTWPVRRARLRAAIESLLSGGARRASEAAASSEPSPPTRVDATVLVVEDNPVNQKIARGLLMKLGYSVDIAASGVEALESLQRRPYDAVLMDCMMPRMDGYEATTRIRALPDERARTPIIAMTANAFREDEERCFEVGMNDFIAKPIRSELLAETLRRWIA